MKPQDIVVLLKLVAIGKRPWRISDLAYELGISASEISASLRRSIKSSLLLSTTREPNRRNLKEFLVHGAAYSFPVKPMELTRGIPTAHSAPPLVYHFPDVPPEQAYVWPKANGKSFGQAIKPLYRTVPEAAEKDANLYELLALVDALRIGRARDRMIATDILRKRLKNA